jgi:hypothetical protein
MTWIDAVRERLQQATALADVLDAAYAAFEAMLPVIHPLQDPASGMFAAFVMAAASAANGRDAVAVAPSLPEHPVLAPPAAERSPSSQTPVDTAKALAGLGQLIAARLAHAGASAQDPADRTACQRAGRHGRDICELLSGTAP